MKTIITLQNLQEINGGFIGGNCIVDYRNPYANLFNISKLFYALF